MTVVTGPTIIARRGDYWNVAFTGAGSLVGRTKLYFTLKAHTGVVDALSVFQLEETLNLLYSNEAPATSANGSLTVDDEVAGDFTVMVKADETMKYAGGSYVYDLQMQGADGPITKMQGAWILPEDVTRAIV